LPASLKGLIVIRLNDCLIVRLIVPRNSARLILARISCLQDELTTTVDYRETQIGRDIDKLAATAG